MRSLLSWTSLVTLILAATFLASAARADDCVDPPNQLAMNECAGKAFDEADKKLNDAYRQMAGRLNNDAATKKLLVDAQRAWIAFRDAECTFQPSRASGGSMHPLLVSNCRTELTKARTERLNAYLTCEGDDMSCPAPAE